MLVSTVSGSLGTVSLLETGDPLVCCAGDLCLTRPKCIAKLSLEFSSLVPSLESLPLSPAPPVA